MRTSRIASEYPAQDQCQAWRSPVTRRLCRRRDLGGFLIFLVRSFADQCPVFFPHFTRLPSEIDCARRDFLETGSSSSETMRMRLPDKHCYISTKSISEETQSRLGTPEVVFLAQRLSVNEVEGCRYAIWHWQAELCEKALSLRSLPR